MTKQKSSTNATASSLSLAPQGVGAITRKLIKPLKKGLKSIDKFLRTYIFTDKNKPVIITVIILALFGDLFFISINSDLRFFGISGFFLITALFYKLSSKFTFILCLLLLVTMYISFLLSNASTFTEKASVWIVLFMAVGIIQQWNE